MRPEMRLGLIVFAMLVVACTLIFFSMQGGENGKVDVTNPNSSPTTASDQQVVANGSGTSTPTIPSNRSTPSETPDLSDTRPSRRPSARSDASDNSLPTRSTPSAGDDQHASSSSPRATRTSPETAVLTPDHSTDADTSEDTLPSSRSSTSDNRLAAADDTDAARRSTLPTPATSSSSKIEELKPVEQRQPIVETRPSTRTESDSATPTPTTSGGRVHTVATGERLWDLAAEAYGDGKYWGVIARANPGIDPDRLLVGQKLTIPPPSVIGASAKRSTTPKPSTSSSAGSPSNSSSSTEAGRATYTVERGDSLVKIADALYADKDRWRDIYELNKDVLKQPNLIRPGMKLKLPPLPD